MESIILRQKSSPTALLGSSFFLIIISMLLIFLMPQRSLAAADDFKLFVNNSQVLNDDSVSTPCGSIIQFYIQQTSDFPIKVDPTGKNDIGLNFAGKLVQFQTAYNPGKYTPRVTVGDITKQFQLEVSQDQSKWLENIPSLSWQVVVLLMFFALLFFAGLPKLLGALTDLIKRLHSLKTGDFELNTSDLSSTMAKAILDTVDALQMLLPHDIATKFLPASLDEEISRYVHIFEFLEQIGLTSKLDNKHDAEFIKKNVLAWNTIGNYYFQHNFEKSKSAYEKAIILDGNDPIAHANLGMLNMMSKRKPDLARKYFEKALDLARSQNVICVIAHMGMVVIAQEANDTELMRHHRDIAKSVFNDAVNINKTGDYWSLYGLGWCWSYEEEPNSMQNAIKYTSLSVDQEKDFYAALYNLACFYALKGETENAINALTGTLTPVRKTLEIFNFQKDPDLKSLRQIPKFVSFCEFLDLKYQVTDS